MAFDSDLTKDVSDELMWAPSVNADHIKISALDGAVTLTGSVNRFVEKYAAERAARRVKGVTAVVNHIDIVVSAKDRRSDQDIAKAANHNIHWDVKVPEDSVIIDVRDGWVTLRGDVEKHYQKECAEQDVRRLRGIAGVSNHVTVKAQIDTAKIKNDIEMALGRSWFESKDVHVQTDDGKVTLSGSVTSLNASDEASVIAWEAEGTTAVQNDLKISNSA